MFNRFLDSCSLSLIFNTTSSRFANDPGGETSTGDEQHANNVLWNLNEEGGQQMTCFSAESQALIYGPPKRRATQKWAGEAWLGIKLSQKGFEEAAVSALKSLPKSIRKKIENVDVVVEDQASRDLLTEMDLRSPRELLGLYQGIPLDRRGFYYGNVLPDKITLFKIPIESLCSTPEEIERKVREVVLHEVGHYFGLDDERLRELMDEEGRE